MNVFTTLEPDGLKTLAASAVRTASGNTDALEGFRQAEQLRVQLEVTAASGTSPTLDVVIEDTLDGVNWNTIGTFAQKVAPGRDVINITALFTNTLRVRWALAGTSPSFTFSVIGYIE